MINRVLVAPLFFMVLSLFSCKGQPQLATFVDPMIGTDEAHFSSRWRSQGSTYPGAVAPHGMVQVSPETSGNQDWLKGYYYWQDTIRFFSMAEHFSGWPDGSAGKGRIMPFCISGSMDLTDPGKVASTFSHQNETAEPGYYAVFLETPGIFCEFAALTRSAIGRFQFKKKGARGLILSGISHLIQVSENTLAFDLPAGRGEMGGSNTRLHLMVEFECEYNIQESDQIYILSFPALENKNSLLFRYAGSYTSLENATMNLKAEMGHWNLEQVREESCALWNSELACVEVSTKNPDDLVMFYTAMYHASLLPLIASDVNGQFPGFESNPPLLEGENHYLYFTPWDGFRTFHPLISFLKPIRSRDMMRSLLRYYRSEGRLPEPEVMTGVHCSALFADALAQGIEDFDIGLAYRGLKEMILEPPYFRPSMELYDSLGYVPYPCEYATTATLEFAYNDWCMAQLAKKLGLPEEYKYLMDRSLNYRHNFHQDDRFMRSRNRDGSWAEVSLYAEADKWNASWFVPHNMRDLVCLMGGDESFVQHLDENMDSGHFILDNEVPMNYPFLYAWTNQPWKSQERASNALRNFFNSSPGGIPGNDDYGAMSSWLVWCSMGLFPACPGTGELVITGPIFDLVQIHRDDGKEISMKVRNNSETNLYMGEFLIDGQDYPGASVAITDLLEAGSVAFTKQKQPDKERWDGKFPYSMGSCDSASLPPRVGMPMADHAPNFGNEDSLKGPCNGLVLHYTFNETGSVVLDYSGCGNHGSLEGDALRVKGKSGSGIRVNDGYVRLPDSESLRIDGDEITLLCWYKPLNDIGQAALVTRGGSDQLKMNSPWQVRFNAGGWGKGICVYTVKPIPGRPDTPAWNKQWCHFAGVLDTDSIHLYVNGRLGQSQRHRGGTAHGELKWRVGSNVEYPETRAPGGIIDEVMIYNRALSTGEIDSIAHLGRD